MSDAIATIVVRFLPDNLSTEARAGEPLLEVANRAGVTIPTGCLMGSCHACEVEIVGGPTLCACISGVPGDSPEVTVNLESDPLW
ncbi:2Fe-2S iron-sulfur cluster-binding protein [Roseofilum casamattae]|uniref:2Fe-2S iron-sulfur cluster-binding protein n=1 Tax=Roseofilum casamattae BLCC-M143 TaxID=3022442 RepID=A0ABT7BRB3_9CYAN|nr:2Fe-2S iron-sulfur cluster-binding protein [Roseofilum casamattae]MDJ1181737.1 2Fe-2S iron-sulfur cluster-binding protein [Roseofilum casamattae BLCC-M143]